MIMSLRRDTAMSDDREKDYAALVVKNCTRVLGEAMVLPIFPKKPRSKIAPA